MLITVDITDRSIDQPSVFYSEGCGAVAEFRGIVRPEENGRVITSLIYEAYQPMAEKVIRRILSEMVSDCEAARVVHRIGEIPAGQTAVLIQVAAKHRAEAFNMLSQFMDRLKEDVPIWKTEAVYV